MCLSVPFPFSIRLQEYHIRAGDLFSKTESCFRLLGGLFDISERKCVRHSGGPLISDLNLIGKFSNDLGIRSITLVSPESNARSNVSANYFHGGKRGTHKKICHNSKSPCSVRNPQSLGRKLKPQLACDSTIGLDRVDDPISPCFFPRARAGTNPCLTPGPKATHACQPY